MSKNCNQPVKVYRLRHFFRNFALTCRPLQVDGNFRTQCDSLSQPAHVYRLTGKLDVASQTVDLYRFTAKYGPNVESPFILSQPVDLYRWTAKYGRSRKCQKLWRRLQVDGHTHFKICHFRSTCRRLQVDGQFSTIMVSEVFNKSVFQFGSFLASFIW